MSNPRIQFGGHRGLGCTDHAFYQDIRDIPNLPVENTYDSIAASFDSGSAYPECDLIADRDGIIFLAHNSVPEDHFFGDAVPPQKLNLLSYADIVTYKTGRYCNGTVPLAADILQLVAERSPGTLPWKIDIELKHLAGSEQDYFDSDYLANIAAIFRASHLEVSDVLFSSYCFHLIAKMSHLLPTAKYGMLFREEKPGDAAGQPPAIPIYTNRQDEPHFQYQPFSGQSVDKALQDWRGHAHPAAMLGYLHPETMTVTDALIHKAAAVGCGLNIWGFMEKLDDSRIQTYRDIVGSCRQADVSLTIITDYLPEMRALDL